MRLNKRGEGISPLTKTVLAILIFLVFAALIYQVISQTRSNIDQRQSCKGRGASGIWRE